MFDILSPVSPASWGALVNYDTWNDPNSVDKWVIHYGGPAVTDYDAGHEREMAVLRAWEKYHIDHNGWRGIAYNYAIGNSGTLYRLRGENKGGHTRGDYEPDGISENTEARAVVFILGGTQQPSDEALATFALMWGERPLLVIGHRDVFLHGSGGTATACPGDYLHGWLTSKGHETLYQEIVSAMSTFADVPSDHPFVDEIERLAAAGVARGRSKDGRQYYDPEVAVTRGQMAAFMVRLADAIKADKV